ncbi:MAG: GNAT family N-acetyltransferase [Cyclobacteriaceae bacterium]
MTILTTERLTLDEAVIQDAEFIFHLLNSPNWIEFIGDRGIKSIKDAERYIQNSLINSYKENGFGLYKMVLLEGNKPIGLCGLLKRTNLDHPDVGFAILPEFEGMGYTYEAAKATIEYAHSALSLPTILAITSEDNVRSQSLIKKIGLHYVGQTRLSTDEEELMLFSN